jgi:hypothetical protein
MHTRRTLRLDADWDLTLTEAGNLALAEGAAATAQNVANEARLFTRDAYFRQEDGVPHFILELGAPLPVKPLVKGHLSRAARRVPDVRRVTRLELESFDREARRLTGRLEFVTVEGENVGLEF